MIHAKDVKPKKWSNIDILYEDEQCSFIIGNYIGKKNKILAMRWNKGEDSEDEIGYPKQGKYPLWFILPEFLYKDVLIVLKNKKSSKINLENIDNALKELNF